MKTRIRICALPLVMVVTLATITGCATHGKPPPVITLDEPVAAQLLPDAPKPIEVVTLSEPLALPAQLKSLSIEAEAKVATESIDEKVRVARANLEARVAPSREGYVNAIQVWPYADGALYQVIDLSALPTASGEIFRRPFFLVLNLAVGGSVEVHSFLLFISNSRNEFYLGKFVP